MALNFVPPHVFFNRGASGALPAYRIDIDNRHGNFRAITPA
jgi:hypothetical protein